MFPVWGHAGAGSPSLKDACILKNSFGKTTVGLSRSPKRPMVAYESRHCKEGQTVQQHHDQRRRIPEAGTYGATKEPDARNSCAS